MKLFEVSYFTDSDSGSYLTVGNNTDNSESIKSRELESESWKDCYVYFLDVDEIKEVDGHKIVVI